MTTHEDEPPAPSSVSRALILFVVLVLGIGLAIGYLTVPGQWYLHLAKPGFTPPNWVFAPAWTILYVLVAIAGWLVWRRDRDSRPMRLWWIQMLLNFCWSPIFFAAHLTGLALAVVLLLLITILAFIATAWRGDRTAALLFLPYAAWVAFASALNAGIYFLN
ncbi:TspO/MBR family protein [Nitrospirillum sp. BR 11164]|uniref:TspO/MBR family protein n=1 Tax=Nitrospirillum sp. BR 11164 TaxID=3104324 RepID=UPI002AFF9849|nr:TspO/MBR family protein [Nitrospirillum sp. BR 11164]MEA1648259.1 TspO/MBR family protein [Nitrospirillum sp. BR 11164]